MKPIVAAACLLFPLSALTGSCRSTGESSSPPVTGTAPAGDTSAEASTAAPRTTVATLEFDIIIDAPVAQVWDTMFDSESYTEWTAPFMAGSYFEGTWAEGERMHFLAPGGSGMVAEIAVNRPHEEMSIRHIGYVMAGVEDTTSEAVQDWAPAYETYRLRPVEGGTAVTVEQDVLAGMEGYMKSTWPRALAALKALCEGA